MIDALATFGRALGIAFQIRDDILDVFGDTDLLGKPLFTDFREGNPTLVVLEAYSRLDPRHQGEFERLFQLRRKRTKHLLRLRELTEISGAAPVVAQEAAAWAERSARALEVLPAGPYRHLLERLAFGAADRRFWGPASPTREPIERKVHPTSLGSSARDGSDEQERIRGRGRQRRGLRRHRGRPPPPAWEPTPVRPRLPIGVAVVAVVIALFAVVMLLAGLLFILNAYLGTIFPPSVEIFQSIDVLGAVILVILGSTLLSIATALWHQETWALWTTIVLVFATTAYLFFTGSITVLFLIFVVLLVYLLAVRRVFY